ncbi:PLAC8-domain-containing protein [Aspergillus uvarum CBS 121591]|uniref:PLAC8-domain-containing protein n=1 Tax=Aspergillus uvarum CBS 121591 TaxID=1448315 RepID=A0A319BRU6_9EURO|nr:PLAC8-domain-containing protein [Aspergillus uvarum CBS 121591]PYH75405.1 PLAC8-domain-containing protein [Aspergillus uvarum CBS 121591]
MENSREWKYGFWDCCSPFKTCCFAFWCPCCLYGRTASRLNNPTLKEHTFFNQDCCLYYLASCCGLSFIPLMMKRARLRANFELEGSSCGDCFKSCCCSICTLMQMEKEVKSRSELLETEGYQVPADMRYG